tara:strand:+ start:50504 stop:50833 length:330 start_codon:yes stop_codon:yes gene_type:complete
MIKNYLLLTIYILITFLIANFFQNQNNNILYGLTFIISFIFLIFYFLKIRKTKIKKEFNIIKNEYKKINFEEKDVITKKSIFVFLFMIIMLSIIMFFDFLINTVFNFLY